MASILSRVQQWYRRLRGRTVSIEYARERVKQGAAYLDEIDPGWHRDVDPETLELSSGGSCILGQLHGDFRLGLGRSQLINLSSAPRMSLSPVAYGFKCVQNVSDDKKEQDYIFLNQAWQEAIRERQEADLEKHVQGDGARPDQTRLPERPGSAQAS